MTKRKSNHGGARPGAGRKRIIPPEENIPPVSSNLDKATRATMQELGEGNVSEGIRRAAKIVSRVGLAACFLLLENKDLGIDIPKEAR